MNRNYFAATTAELWGIDSETSALREVLMCKPEHFAWLPTCETAVKSLARGLPFDRELALSQHRELSDRIEECGAVIRWLDPVQTLPDLCWTRDSSHMTPWGALITSLSEPARVCEHAEVEAFYQKAGHAVWQHISRGHVEGGDVHFLSPGLAVFGYSNQRTTRTGAEQLAEWVEQKGWEVRLQPVNSKFVHLDVVFCMAAENLAVVCEEALGTDFVSWLRSRGIMHIAVSIDEALSLGCNLLALGNERVIVPAHCRSVRGQLKAEGLDVIAVELDMFTPGGGGVHCLTQPLSRAPSA